jgi:hypothetical protein
MMVEQMILTILLLGWLFYRFAIPEEQRQSLLGLASERGLELTNERAARAAGGGTTRLRERLLRAPAPDSGREQVRGMSQSSQVP